MENEQKPSPRRGFEISEFCMRTSKAQNMMSLHGLSAMLLTTEPEFRYFSGFHTPFWQSPTRPWFLVIPSKGKPVAVIPKIRAACMANTWIEDIRIWPASQSEDDGISLLTETLREVAGSTGKEKSVPLWNMKPTSACRPRTLIGLERQSEPAVS